MNIDCVIHYMIIIIIVDCVITYLVSQQDDGNIVP